MELKNGTPCTLGKVLKTQGGGRKKRTQPNSSLGREKSGVFLDFLFFVVRGLRGRAENASHRKDNLQKKKNL